MSVPDKYLVEVFGPEGLFAERLPEYEAREGQLAFARAVHWAISDSTALLAEVPTGTGKGFAYLVPALRYALDEDLRVLVVTANIALQEQLVTKDLPFLAETLPWEFTFALMKGRSNYLCRREYKRNAAEVLLARDAVERRERERLAEWAAKTETGDKSELPFEPSSRVWEDFSTSADDCHGEECAHRAACFAQKAKEAAKEAGLVVCNYHLLFAHLRVKELTEKDLVLPPFDVVVCDEAHKAADIARDFFGFRLTAYSLKRLGRRLKKTDREALNDSLGHYAEEFFKALAAYRRAPAYKRRFREADPVPSKDLSDLLVEIEGAYKGFSAGAEELADKTEFRKVAARCATVRENLSAAMSFADREMVYFIEGGGSGKDVFSLRGKPISVAERLRLLLWDEVRSAVLTSATLAVGEDFGHLIEELGLEIPRTLIAQTPFNFREQAFFIAPEGLPNPKEEGFSEAVAERLSEIVELAQGRTLALFTSWRGLKTAAERLRCRIPYRLLVQGEAPRTQLVEEFRVDESSVLLGTDSFWGGVDVPGPALSCLVIDRLPFPTPEDPVLDALSERDGRVAFTRHFLPRAAIAFKQGVGRLIRRSTDRGVVVVLDSRIVSAWYGKIFLRNLPRMSGSQSLEDLSSFLDGEP